MMIKPITLRLFKALIKDLPNPKLYKDIYDNKFTSESYLKISKIVKLINNKYYDIQKTDIKYGKLEQNDLEMIPTYFSFKLDNYNGLRWVYSGKILI